MQVTTVTRTCRRALFIECSSFADWRHTLMHVDCAHDTSDDDATEQPRISKSAGRITASTTPLTLAASLTVHARNS